MGKWVGAIDPGDSPDEVYDSRTVFERRCRQRGTRINWIMTMIERGLEDKEIAARVRKRTGHPCDMKTISVYRKALEGKLCDMRTGRGNQSIAGSIVKNNYMRVGELYFTHGVKRSEIAGALDLSQTTIDSCVERYRREFKPKGRHKNGRAHEGR